MRDYLHFYINGRKFQVGGEAAFGRLAAFLRDELRLFGTKIVCAEGACGACGVLKGQWEGDQFRYRAVNSCLQSLYQIDACHIVTVEGLSQIGSLSAVQEAMIAAHGAQCGYCTPGIVVSLTAGMERGESDGNIRETICGNLCRCTGYLPILEAGRSVDTLAYRPLSELYPEDGIAADLFAHRAETVQISSGDSLLYAPATLGEAVEWKLSHPDAVIVAGATELAVPPAIEIETTKSLLSLGRIDELSEITRDGDTLIIGASATWTEIAEFTRDEFPELSEYLHRFAAPSLRNVGTIGGSIVQGSPMADSLPPLLALEAIIEVVETSGTRLIPVSAFSEDNINNGIVSRVLLPLPRSGQTIRMFKISSRRGFDRSIVSAAFLLEKEGDHIQTLSIALSGVGPKVSRLPKTEEFLQGKRWEEASLRAAGKTLRAEISPVSDGRASAEYRALLAENMLLKFYHSLEGSD